MKIVSFTGLPAQVNELERQLKAEGCSRAFHNSQKLLAFNQYLRTEHCGTETSFEGPVRHTLTWVQRS